MQATKCDSCGEMIQPGHWPFCPHEILTDGKCQLGDEPIEPYWDENLGADPVYITSRGQRRKIMREEGLDYKTTDARRRMSGGKRLYFFL